MFEIPITISPAVIKGNPTFKCYLLSTFNGWAIRHNTLFNIIPVSVVLLVGVLVAPGRVLVELLVENSNLRLSSTYELLRSRRGSRHHEQETELKRMNGLVRASRLDQIHMQFLSPQQSSIGRNNKRW